MESITKTCKHCNIEYPISEYPINRTTKAGRVVLRTDCKACRKIRQHEVYIRRKEKKL